MLKKKVVKENKFKAFFSFLNSKINNFKNLSLGEQIAFGCIGLGILLILVSLFLFIV